MHRADCTAEISTENKNKINENCHWLLHWPVHRFCVQDWRAGAIGIGWCPRMK